MKRLYLNLTGACILLFCASIGSGDFLPEPNGDQIGLKYGEPVAGIPLNPPK